MLILTRKAGEVLRIGDEVKVIVLELKGKQVRIGIEAPTDVGVHREEVYLQIQAEQTARPAVQGKEAEIEEAYRQRQAGEQ